MFPEKRVTRFHQRHVGREFRLHFTVHPRELVPSHGVRVYDHLVPIPIQC